MMRPLFLLLIAASVFARPLAPQTFWCCNDITGPFLEIDLDTHPVDPITDRMRYEIAAAQRDFVIVKGPYDKALAHLQSKIAEADKACGGKFDPQSFACVNNPPDKK